jgi:HlyD family secretion protein
MTDQLSRDLASLKIERAPSERRPSLVTRWLLVVAIGAAAVGVYPKAKGYVESYVFKVAVDSTEVILQSAVASQVDLTATGYVIPQVTAKVGSKAAGRISKVLVQEGDTVRAGQLLFELDPADERTALGSAQARVKAAGARLEASRAELREAEAQLIRDEKLAEMGATAPAIVEDRKLRVAALSKQAEAAEAEVEVSRAEANVSGQQLRNLRIVSPIAATAVTKPAQLGDVVAASMTLVELVAFDSLLIEVDVPEARLGQVKPNSPCEVVLDAAPTERLKGKVADFTPRVNRAKATATVKVKLVESAARLWPDMGARISFLAKEVDDALRRQPPKKLVPRAAIASDGDRQGLWVIADNRLHFVPVTLGPGSGNHVELTAGPAPGTRVVLNPGESLRAGQSVKDRQSTTDS